MKLNEIFGMRRKETPRIDVYGVIQIEGQGKWGTEIVKVYITGPFDSKKEVEQDATKYDNVAHAGASTQSPEQIKQMVEKNDIPCIRVKAEQ